MNETPYTGRFAPSPTGPLHFGSLVAALGSYLQARHHGGRWLLRIEDIDPPREVAGASDAILTALDHYGLHWDGSELFQHSRTEAYLEAIDQLHRDGLLFACSCSRKEIADANQRLGLPDHLYPGTCRGRHQPPKGRHALRLRGHERLIAFDDRLQGHIEQQIEREVGDFVIRRADGLFAYQLAVVVDDAAQDISEVVRGCDLIDSTPRQIYLQQLLGLPTPSYLHLPVAVNPRGEKLSKQTYAEPLPLDTPLPQLLAALRFLGQQPPAELADASRDELLAWAIAHWDWRRIAASRAIEVPMKPRATT